MTKATDNETPGPRPGGPPFKVEVKPDPHREAPGQALYIRADDIEPDDQAALDALLQRAFQPRNTISYRGALTPTEPETSRWMVMETDRSTQIAELVTGDHTSTLWIVSAAILGQFCLTAPDDKLCSELANLIREKAKDSDWSVGDPNDPRPVELAPDWFLEEVRKFADHIERDGNARIGKWIRADPPAPGYPEGFISTLNAQSRHTRCPRPQHLRRGGGHALADRRYIERKKRRLGELERAEALFES